MLVKKIFIFPFVVLIFQHLHAHERNTLVNSISNHQLEQSLTKGTEWVPFPPYSDRSAWESLPTEVRNAMIKKGEDAQNCNWPIINATDYLEFTRSGDRQIMEYPLNVRQIAVRDLALAELIEGKGRFLEPLINGIWAICEQSTWVISAHLYMQKSGAGLPDPEEVVIDLISADIGAMIAWIHYFFADEFDKISPMITKKIRKEIDVRLLEPYYERSDFWWMGFSDEMVNNWNVWINYNILQCILLIESSNSRRIAGVSKVIKSIDKFINYYPDDGGCEEGPDYWRLAGGKLFEGLELLYTITGGTLNIFENELIKNIGKYIYRVYINDPFFVNFADASPKGGINPGLVYRYGKAIDDKVLQKFGAFYAKKKNFASTVPTGTFETIIRDLFQAKEIVSAESAEPLIAEYWLPESQIAIARDKENSKQGFFFAAKGGHNDESHNHNDVGTFVLYYNGLPAIIDVGVGTYTRQTFSNERYSIWTMQSEYHNLPVINGKGQKNGKQYTAHDVSFQSNKKSIEFSLNIAKAYPENANINFWKRKYKLQRSKSFTINDKFILSENNGVTSLHFITPCNTLILKNGIIHLEGENFTLEMQYDNSKMAAKTETIEISDPRLQNSWGNSLTMLIFEYINPKLSDNNNIIIKAL